MCCYFPQSCPTVFYTHLVTKHFESSSWVHEDRSVGHLCRYQISVCFCISHTGLHALVQLGGFAQDVFLCDSAPSMLLGYSKVFQTWLPCLISSWARSHLSYKQKCAAWLINVWSLTWQCPTKILAILLCLLSCANPNIWFLVMKLILLVKLRALLSSHRPPLFEHPTLPFVYSIALRKRHTKILTTLPWLPSCPEAYMPKLTLVVKLWVMQ